MSIGLFIDASYCYKVFRDKIDYIKLRQHIEITMGDTIDEAYYFSADNDPPVAANMHAFLSTPYPAGPGFRVKIYRMSKKNLFWPDHLGGNPVTHPTEKNTFYELRSQKGVDVGLVFHMTRSYYRRKWSHLVLVAGDGDFNEPVQNLVEAEGVDLVLVGSTSTISSELQSYARSIIEIDKEPLHQQLLLSAKI
ncbi:hypothetical protein BH11BAC2_BH11BAC2_00170 [soil metagenome]